MPQQKVISNSFNVTPVYDGQDGKDGKGIVSADVMFCIISGTGTPADTANWQTTVAQLNLSDSTKEYYLWQATYITYTDNTHAYTGKVCLGQVKDFASVTEQYARGTASAADSNTWQNDTPPAPQKGSYLWTRTKLVFANGNISFLPSEAGYCLGYYGEDGSVVTIGSNGNWYIDGVDTGVRAEGKDGTGVELKGSVEVLNTTTGKTSLQSLIGMSKGDCYVVEENRHLYFYLGTGAWPNNWRDLGEFKGEPGKSNYIHIAYATWIYVNASGEVTAQTGFTVVQDSSTGHEWIGFCTDENEDDPGKYATTDAARLTAAKQYKWNYVKGMDGNGSENVFIRTKTKDVIPTVTNSASDSYTEGGKTYNAATDEYRPPVGNYDNTNMSANRWTDDPMGCDATWRYEWQATRKKTGGMWGNFTVAPNPIHQFVVSKFQSRVFCRTNNVPNTPISTTPDGTTYNTFDNPVPPEGNDSGGNTVVWSDGIPAGTGLLWASVRWFYNDGTTDNWSTPQIETDTNDTDIEFAFEQANDAQPADPSDGNRHGGTGTQVWFDPVLDAAGLPSGKTWSDMVWRAERELVNGQPKAGAVWVVSRIKGEQGAPGGQAESIGKWFRAELHRLPLPPNVVFSGGTPTNFWEGQDPTWGASKKFLYCVERYRLTTGDTFWGDPYFYAEWAEQGPEGPQGPQGNDGYGLTLTPSALIFEEKIDNERNSYIEYSNNTVSAVVFKGKNTKQPTITKLTSSATYKGCVLDKITISYNTVTMSSGSIEGGVTSGYFTVNIKADDGAYDQNVRINFYVNRLGSWRASIENGISTEVGNQITYGLQDGGAIKTAYDAAIEKSATGLTQQFTEQISRASAESRNLFGFNKKIAFSNCLPFIQGYGLVCQPWNNTSDKTARIYNLGMYGRLGYYTVSCQVRTSASNGYVRLQMNWHEATGGSQAVSNGTKGVVYARTSAWTELQTTFLFSDASESHIGTSVPEGGEGSYTIGDANGYIDIGQINGANNTTKMSVSGNYIYVRHLKIEYHDFATDFCEADEDIACLGGLQLAASPTFNTYRTTGSSVDTYPATVDGRSDVYQVYVSGLNNTYPWYSGSTGQTFWDYISKNSFVNIEAGKCYTLSFWAKSSVSGFIITHYLWRSGYNLITNVDREVYVPTAVGNSYEGVSSSGGTLTSLSTEWKQYFVHFYAANTIPSANLIPLRVENDLNYNTAKGIYRSTAYIYMSDIQFQEGYVLPTSYFSSLISQNARRIALVQQSGNKLAGIDIQNGTVNLFGDRVTFSDSTGTIKDKVWIDPATGAIHAVEGVFGGLIKKSNTIITASNIDYYLDRTEDRNDVLDFEKTGTFVTFSDLTGQIGIYMPGLEGTVTTYNDTRRNYARSLIGNKVVFYNKSSYIVSISGDVTLDGLEVSFSLNSNEMVVMECQVGKYTDNSGLNLYSDRNGYEEIKWVCTKMKID